MMSYGDPRQVAWYLDEGAAESIVRGAVEGGVTFFDTADMYSEGISEEITGRLLRSLFRQRGDYVLATKVYYPMGTGPNDRGLSRKHIMDAIDASLRRLGTDYVDLYQIHRWDHDTPIEETMQALDDVVRAGKVRYIGASLMRTWQFAKAQHAAQAAGWTRFVSMQNRYNLVYREEEREMIPCCLDQGVGVLPYSPLARGLLARTGVTARVEDEARVVPDNDLEIVEVVRKVAADRGVAPARVALAWLLGKLAVTAPIIGATKAGHIDDALAAVDLCLSDAEVSAVESVYRAHELYGYS
jgi:aryl-alcohol dehydrogenase-like predicted oxidoreductase